MKLDAFIFNDKIVKNISCGHTKFEVIITEASASASVKRIINMLQGYALFFSVLW
jgi:hypothetical protein